MRPVPEASEWSVTSASHIRDSTKSLMPTQNATRSKSFGCCSREPHQLGQRRHRVQRRAGPPVQGQPAGGLPQPPGLPGRAGVGPGQRRGERGAVGVEPDQRVHGRAERQPGDMTVHVGPDRADRGQHRVEDLLRVLLGPARVRLVQRVADRRARHLPATGVERDRLRAGGPEVHPDDDGHSTTEPDTCARSIPEPRPITAGRPRYGGISPADRPCAPATRPPAARSRPGRP